MTRKASTPAVTTPTVLAAKLTNPVVASPLRCGFVAPVAVPKKAVVPLGVANVAQPDTPPQSCSPVPVHCTNPALLAASQAVMAVPNWNAGRCH
ncbi:MAG: hypothetical protein ACYC4Q_07940 [Victivallaceae bacterium]